MFGDTGPQLGVRVLHDTRPGREHDPAPVAEVPPRQAVRSQGALVPRTAYDTLLPASSCRLLTLLVRHFDTFNTLRGMCGAFFS